MCVCDYQFSDEDPSEVTDRLKEMLDIDAAEEDLDTRHESPAEMRERDITAGEEEDEDVDECNQNVLNSATFSTVYSGWW